MKNEFKPVKKDYCNFVYTAPAGMDDCSDLHVLKNGGMTLSIWKLTSIIERLKFLFKGEISLTTYGEVFVPTSITNGEAVAHEENTK